MPAVMTLGTGHPGRAVGRPHSHRSPPCFPSETDRIMPDDQLQSTIETLDDRLWRSLISTLADRRQLVEHREEVDHLLATEQYDAALHTGRGPGRRQ